MDSNKSRKQGLLSCAILADAVIIVKHSALDAADKSKKQGLISCAILADAGIIVKHSALDAADNIQPGTLKPFKVSPTLIPVRK